MPHLIGCIEQTPDGPKQHVARMTFHSLNGRLLHVEAYFRRLLPGKELSAFEALPLPYVHNG